MVKDSIDIGIVVEDLEKASHFYGEILGLPVVREVEITADKAAQAGCASGRFQFKAFQRDLFFNLVTFDNFYKYCFIYSLF